MRDASGKMPSATDVLREDCFDEIPVACVELDAHGYVSRANGRAVDLLGYDRAALIGKEVWKFVAGEETREGKRAYLAAIAAGTDPAPVRRSFVVKSGEFHTFDLFRSLIVDGDGHAAGMRYFFFDVTDLLAAGEENQRARIELERALSSTREAIILTDALGVITYANRAAEKLTGWQSADLLGQLIAQRIPIVGNLDSDQPPFDYSTAIERYRRARVVILDRGQGQLRVEFSVSPIVDERSDSTYGMAILIHDGKECPMAHLWPKACCTP